MESWEKDLQEMEDAEAIAALLPRLIGAQRRQMAQDLAGYGLTFPQYIALTILERSRGECRMGPLAAAALQSAASMTGIVDRLLERGLVRRERHPQDRRSVVVQLTERGRGLLDEVKESRRQRELSLLAAVSAEDRQQLRHILTRIVAWMEKGE